MTVEKLPAIADAGEVMDAVPVEQQLDESRELFRFGALDAQRFRPEPPGDFVGAGRLAAQSVSGGA